MFTWLTSLKSKLVIILGAVISGLLLYTSALKRAALRKELTQAKNASKRKDRAWEALNEGVNEESMPVERGYFDDDNGK